ncbi:MAG: type II toxin-antitoxin system VapC family toxin [Dehalococcoidia bacterium]
MVVDASAIVELLLGKELGRRFARVLDSGPVTLRVLGHTDSEVLSGFIKRVRRGSMTNRQASERLRAYLLLPLVYHEAGPLLMDAWQLRENFSAYDALYVALADRLGEPLITADGRLARAASAFTTVEVISLTASS